MASVHDLKVKILQVDRLLNKLLATIAVETTLEYTTNRAFGGNQLISYNGVLALLEDGGFEGGTARTLVVPFAGVTGLVINWQTDVPDGAGDNYVTLLGNGIPKPVVDIVTGVDNEYQRIPFDLKYTVIDGEIQTMTFDWAIAQTGNIIF